jgi:ABC-type cobalamin/Fe3+-siderophores transport system ATPase subunit
MSIINVKNAEFAYNGENVFKNININLNQGEILCLFGPNGCGKTTLLENILGLLKLKNGSIHLNGKDIHKMKPHEIAKKIAYVPQIHDKTFPYKVKEIVLMGRAAYTPIFSMPSKEDKNKVDEVLELLGINNLRDRPYTKLSGGEARLVMVARALAQESQIILMDEPTAHLDFRHELEILETIVKLIKEKGLSIIMATHFPNHSLYFQNNGIKTLLAIMNNKKILFSGTPENVLTEENMKTLFHIESQMLSYSNIQNEKLKYLIPLKIIQDKN